jgi:hypothetical protein
MKEWNILNHRSFLDMILLDEHKSLSRKPKVILSILKWETFMENK